MVKDSTPQKTKWHIRIKPGESVTDKNGVIYVNENKHVSARITIIRVVPLKELSDAIPSLTNPNTK